MSATTYIPTSRLGTYITSHVVVIPGHVTLCENTNSPLFGDMGFDQARDVLVAKISWNISDAALIC
jgi:hypothetical protein